MRGKSMARKTGRNKSESLRGRLGSRKLKLSFCSKGCWQQQALIDPKTPSCYNAWVLLQECEQIATNWALCKPCYLAATRRTTSKPCRSSSCKVDWGKHLHMHIIIVMLGQCNAIQGEIMSIGFVQRVRTAETKRGRTMRKMGKPGKQVASSCLHTKSLCRHFAAYLSPELTLAKHPVEIGYHWRGTRMQHFGIAVLLILFLHLFVSVKFLACAQVSKKEPWLARAQRKGCCRLFGRGGPGALLAAPSNPNWIAAPKCLFWEVGTSLMNLPTLCQVFAQAVSNIYGHTLVYWMLLANQKKLVDIHWEKKLSDQNKTDKAPRS